MIAEDLVGDDVARHQAGHEAMAGDRGDGLPAELDREAIDRLIGENP